MAIHIQEYGDPDGGCLMVFLHGGGVSGWMWDKQAAAFARYHCLVPDLPGHGFSRDDMEFTIRSSAEELLSIMEDQAKGRKIIVTGFSLGAQVLTQMLGMRPELIDYAIINSALVRPIPSARRLIGPAVRLSFPLIRYRWFAKLQAKTLYLGEEYLERYVEESRQMELKTLIRVLEENMSFRIPAGFSEAAGKILVTVGEREKSVMKQSARDLVAANPRSMGVVLPRIGHGVPLAKPELFNELLKAWIQGGDLPGECRRI
ncbi:alpha/beta hydrolase [Paenibacillus sp. FSL K6-1217]|uniref:alpha/beta fold hydrolase n=1 Tax=Paenibacillus sp. FSL K6-1217 TaxID=2921466 RepID=UPI0032520277